MLACIIPAHPIIYYFSKHKITQIMQMGKRLSAKNNNCAKIFNNIQQAAKTFTKRASTEAHKRDQR